MILPMLCVTIFVILVVWFLLPKVARLMIHTPTAISICVCLSMVQLMAVFISMRCTLCCYFFSSGRRHTRCSRDWSSDVCSSDLPSLPDEACVLTDTRFVMRAGLIRQGRASWLPSGQATPEVTGAAMLLLRNQAGLARSEAPVRERSEERRVGKEGRSRGGAEH